MPVTPALMGPGPWATLEPDVNMTGSKRTLPNKEAELAATNPCILNFYTCASRKNWHT